MTIVARWNKCTDFPLNCFPRITFNWSFTVHPFSIDLIIGGSCWQDWTVRLGIVMWVQWVTRVASLFKDSVPQLGPFVNKKFCRVTPLSPGFVPRGDKFVREDSDVTRLTTASTLLCVRSLSKDWMFVAVYPDICSSIGGIPVRFSYDCLAFAVPPGWRYDESGWLEKDSVTCCLIKNMWSLIEEFLKKRIIYFLTIGPDKFR